MQMLQAVKLCSLRVRAYSRHERRQVLDGSSSVPMQVSFCGGCWPGSREQKSLYVASACGYGRHRGSQLTASFGICFYPQGRLQARKQGGAEPRRRLSVSATALPLEADEPSPLQSLPNVLEKIDWLDAFYRFSRPHTMMGTTSGVISVSLLAIQSTSDISLRCFVGVVQALVPALCMNIYVVGLNQIYDIEIDKLNKPTLPLASGEFTVRTASTLVICFAAVSMALGLAVGSKPLLAALTLSMVLGTAYSIDLPLLRWKRSAIAAACCILAVRAIVVQIAFYLHMQSFVFGRPWMLTRPLLFATSFMCFFSLVIALAKDIPDVDGDRNFGIRSFSVRMGQKPIFWLCVWLIQGSYAAAVMVGASSPVLWSKVVIISGHLILAVALFFRSKAVDLKSKTSITSFYMFIWQLFYMEYILIPFMR